MPWYIRILLSLMLSGVLVFILWVAIHGLNSLLVFGDHELTWMIVLWMVMTSLMYTDWSRNARN